MVIAFLESVKYVGHMFPVALIRFILGYHYISMVITRVQSGYLKHAYISESLNLSDAQGATPGIYFEIFKGLVQSQWLMMTYILLGIELVVGISYLLGFGVRIASLLGMLLSLHIYSFFSLATSPGQIYLFYIHLLFCLVGAGRCLGVDYYFFKSRRGLLW